MSKTTAEITTDENGYFSKTLPLASRGASASNIRFSITLLSPFATGIWGSVDIDARDGRPSHQRRDFVLWHSETVDIGSWNLDGGEKIIVFTGKTNPTRPNTQLILEIAVGV